jgi:hypothetical protein
MCCFFTLMVFLGPRIAGIFWWLFQPARWSLAFNGSWIWPVLGLIFLPWTTLMYVIVAPGGIVGIWEWGFLILMLVFDISSYVGGGFGNKDRIPGMS